MDPLIPIVTIEGQYFYRGNKRFIARGIVYQVRTEPAAVRLGHRDPLDDRNYEQVLQDIEAFKELNVNAIWVYNHDPKAKHDYCMQALANNGIYVIFETSHPKMSISRIYPAMSYNSKLLERYSQVIDSVSQYRNTLGVCLASQVVHQINYNTYNNVEDVWGVLGRTIRDMKQYMRYKHFDKDQRILPLCVADGQWASLNTTTFQYLTDLTPGAGPVRPANGKVDFYCFIHYDATEDASVAPYLTSRVKHTQEEEIMPLHSTDVDVSATEDSTRLSKWAEQLPMDKFLDAEEPVPVLISEYGATIQRPRIFDEVKQLYGEDMNSPLLKTLSGGFVYEFEDSVNRYGMVSRSGNGVLKRLPDYFNFRDQMRTAAPRGWEAAFKPA